MSSNELASSMGKKIADALKKQNKANAQTDAGDIADQIQTDEEVALDNTTLALHNDTEEIKDSGVDFQDKHEDDESPYDDLDLYDTPSVEIDPEESEDYAPVFKIESGDLSDNPDFKLSINSEEDTEEFEMPNNINVLKRLITQLPSGVSKQTGAQIIRQTIEALGIPMKSVLQDAQRVKDCLNSSIKDCNFTIQEYKSNIRNLEKQNLSYQKQLSKLNDIIGLFVYTDK